MQRQLRTVESWGRLGRQAHRVEPLSEEALVGLTNQTPCLPIGKARSYGDVCLNPGGLLLDTTTRDRFVSFDRVTGVLHAQAGVTLGQIQATMLPQGWLLPVSPGTQFVTLGGAVANDVHGKNHHRMGSFGRHVTYVDLLRSDQGLLRCTESENTDLFRATIGGLGLTGAIMEVGVQLRPVDGGWLECETLTFDGLDTFFSLAETSQEDWEYTVSWLDCATAGRIRGCFFRANHATNPSPLPSRRRNSLPVTPPFSLINQTSIKAFNHLYFQSNSRKLGKHQQDIWSFFYPLDSVRNWNRAYGPKGFYQYQSVIPPGAAEDATRDMIDTIAQAQQGSFLMVLKTFGGRSSPGLLTFPMEGVTFAMDFPNRGQATLDLFDRLDQIVIAAGGRLYPAKDARMSAKMFAKGYPDLERFLLWRDPAFGSAMSERLMGR